MTLLVEAGDVVQDIHKVDGLTSFSGTTGHLLISKEEPSLANI